MQRLQLERKRKIRQSTNWPAMHFFLLEMWSSWLVLKTKIRAIIKDIEEDKVFHGLYASTHQLVISAVVMITENGHYT